MNKASRMRHSDAKDSNRRSKLLERKETPQDDDIFVSVSVSVSVYVYSALFASLVRFFRSISLATSTSQRRDVCVVVFFGVSLDGIDQ
jgi:hypothetical protein